MAYEKDLLAEPRSVQSSELCRLSERVVLPSHARVISKIAMDDVIGIVGLGLLGRGIATCFLAHGFRVLAYEKSGEEGFAVARKYIAAGIEEVLAREASSAMAASWLHRYQEASDFAAFSGCSFVIESVTEDLATKQGVFDQLEEVLEPTAPIASNTSALPIGILQKPRRHPSRFLGMHWAEPAYATRFLELICGEQTSVAALRHAEALGREVGKEPCIVERDIPGFIVNRLGYAMYREAVHLLESGVANVETIDRSFQNACGLWASLCGPFRWIDITGGPALYAKAMRGVLPTLDNNADLPKTLQKMEADGASFYPYEPNELERWQKLFHEQAWRIRSLQRDMGV